MGGGGVAVLNEWSEKGWLRRHFGTYVPEVKE